MSDRVTAWIPPESRSQRAGDKAAHREYLQRISDKLREDGWREVTVHIERGRNSKREVYRYVGKWIEREVFRTREATDE